MAVVLSVGNSPLLHRNRPPHSSKTCFDKRLNSNVNFTGGTLLLLSKGKLGVNSAVNFFSRSTFRVRSFQQDDTEYSDSASYIDNSERQDETADVGSQEIKTTITRSSLLAQLAILLGIAATVTVLSICLKQPNQGSSSGIQILAGGASTSSLPGVGFSFNAFGYRIILPEYTPGWIYFWLLMAAGCGLFISEEALNIWVGISIARMLSLDGTRQSLVESFSRNAPHILSTVLWVYWGVCISDMIPFYLGRLFKKSGVSDDVYSKLGINKDKALGLTSIVQRYGNLIGFVERFSLGVRNPTAFFAGALDISPECFFAGVCCGGLITLPVQLGIGFLLRERPVFALATVATVVGIWTIFPYAVAASTALFFYLRKRYSD
nr:SNARE associated Golgi protein [Tanacetum cinerariifolium]